MKRMDCEAYRQDVATVASLGLPWQLLQGKTVMISGATGMIGSFLIDVLMEKDRDDGLDCSVLALTRNPEAARYGRLRKWLPS